MKAAVLHQPRTPLVIEDVAIGKPGPREVLVRTAAVGVCHSDLHFVDGAYPHPVPTIPGHEAAGVVEQVGAEVRTVRPGDHVITCLSAYCGHCEHCLTGHLSLCTEPDTRRREEEEPRLQGAHGNAMHQFLNLSAFAEQMLIHEHALVAIRRDMPLDRAALIGCAVTTGMGAVIHTARVQPGETVAVIGCGGIGLATVNSAAIAGAGRIIAIDRVPGKLELARKFGATDVVDASEGNVPDAVRALTGGGVHHAFEAIGLKETTEQAFAMLRRGGTATVIGMIAPGVKIELKGSDFLGEKRIQGSLMGSNRFPVDMPRMVDFYMAGRLHLDALIAQRLPLDRINDAFDELRRGELARSVILFD
ncbi:putative S-(hydroxymethyl)glutathione dehydrogenase; zinc-containing alcohol dehydrogenase family [Cupriavidus phytorum]|uniref:S-(Hydroxymethyl)glutathione dehydrogenase zinc-containing alcohol dehydrogenase family n=2 Tax=Cupriavidus TaxID=106589 RepID=A0A975XEV3_9BURK|nr:MULTISPECIES: Zn-dependent alcohol dehydrogenase [Cupriavidus]PZX33730.1 S-(hydroxymethyl)glutathione dehydrogenase/alcohol dehydrogenase [Cupriavidus alkaliphilus]SOY65845.1 putative S-(hydroxymethyl)glutathione dehydrogenase; zinc-containing alcohol dehydrogenase family [Cupriavidus taiwanensis]